VDGSFVCNGGVQLVLLHLVVGLLCNPGLKSSLTENALSSFIIDEDKQGERHSWNPPVDFERVHTKTFVHSWSVAKDNSQKSLEAETKVHEPILHSLLEYRVHSCLTNDEIGPLYDNNGDKESRVASVLKDLSVLVCPFLTIRVFEVVDGQ